MDVECAWVGPPDQDGFTPFGPDPKYAKSEPAWYGRGFDVKNDRKYFERHYQGGNRFAPNDYYICKCDN